MYHCFYISGAANQEEGISRSSPPFAAALDVVIRGAAGGGFIVNLKANDVLIVFVMLQNFTNHAFAVEAVGWIGEVRVLAQSVGNRLAAKLCDHDFGMFLEEPSGNRICGRAHNNADVGRVKPFDGPVHPRKIEFAILGLPKPPAGFADADDADAGIFNSLPRRSSGRILLQTIAGVSSPNPPSPGATNIGSESVVMDSKLNIGADGYFENPSLKFFRP